MNIKNLTILTVVSLILSIGAFMVFGREPYETQENKSPIATGTPIPSAQPEEPIPTKVPEDPLIPTPKPSNTPITYECPESEYINCMPIVAPEKQFQCSQSYLDWVKMNCPNFKGVAY